MEQLNFDAVCRSILSTSHNHDSESNSKVLSSIAIHRACLVQLRLLNLAVGVGSGVKSWNCLNLAPVHYVKKLHLSPLPVLMELELFG